MRALDGSDANMDVLTLTPIHELFDVAEEGTRSRVAPAAAVDNEGVELQGLQETSDGLVLRSAAASAGVVDMCIWLQRAAAAAAAARRCRQHRAKARQPTIQSRYVP